MSLDTQHAEKLARAQCEELERQAKQLLNIGYKLNELEIVSFQSDGRKEVWPKVLVQYFMTQLIGPIPKDEPPLLTEQLKWSSQVPWADGLWWVKGPGDDEPIIVKVRVEYGNEGQGDLTRLDYWHPELKNWTPAINMPWKWAGPIPKPIN